MAETVDLNFKKTMIKGQACFAPLTGEELDMLATLWNEKHVKAGETIVTEGDPVDSVFLIVSGTAEVRHISINEDGSVKIQSIATLGPNEAIGLNETGFYSVTGIRTATVVALSDMVLLRLSVAAFHGFALAYHHVNEVMHNQAAKMMNMKY